MMGGGGGGGGGVGARSKVSLSIFLQDNNTLKRCSEVTVMKLRNIYCILLKMTFQNKMQLN